MQTWQKIKNNSVLLNKFKTRATVVDAIRAFFKTKDFLEVETPLLVENPGTEPFLEVFKTELKVAGHASKTGFLTTSPELSMKKLLAGGSGNIFQICKSFRNQEGLSDFHNPEFTILEWYRTNADYTQIMRDFEELMASIFKAVFPEDSSLKLKYQRQVFDLRAPWERISVIEAFEKYVGVDAETLLSENKLLQTLESKGYHKDAQTIWEEAFNQLLLNEIEPHLGRTKPTILYDYPTSQAALAKKKLSDPRFAERFEVFLGGLELGNAFSELIDEKEQRSRMVADLKEREKLGKEQYGLDEQFLRALESGMPETGGIAVGVDRLVMLFSNSKSIKETLLFPVEDVFNLE